MPGPETPIRFPNAGKVLALVGLIAYAASLLTVALAFPEGTPVSSDPGAPRIALWHEVLPNAVGIALALALPAAVRAPLLPVVAQDRRNLPRSTQLLVVAAVVFAVVATFAGPGALYPLFKIALLMLIPWAIVSRWRPAVRLDQPSAAWRWWAPGMAVAAWWALRELTPWATAWEPGDASLGLILVAATMTALSAGVGEELFYRRWLQSRLEALFGGAAGIAVSTLAFGLMHLGTHGTGHLGLDIARVIAYQGSFGLFMGVLWWRHRNMTMNIIAHVLVNGWVLIAYLLRLAF